jgi:hypothetical protein
MCKNLVFLVSLVMLLGVASSVQAEPVDPGTDGLVAYYALDNDANDSSGNGLNGVITTVGGVDPTATYVAGPPSYGAAIDLLPSGNGTQGSYVNCGADPNFDFVDAMTVGAWINVRSVPDEWRAIVCKGDDAWRISLNGATTAIQYSIAGYGTRPAFSVDGTTQVGFDSWHYVCGTYDTIEGAKLYIDGELEGTLADLTGISVNTFNVTIGANEGDTGWKPYRLFDGQIDEVRIYDRALSVDEISYLMQLPPKVIWVSFHDAADDAPSANAAAAGFTEAPDKAYTDLLTANGYDVTRFLTTGTPDVNVLNAADLVIISRSVNSGNYGNASATTWNGVTAPMIITGGYPLRNSRMGYTTGATIPDIAGDIKLAVSNPDHPIFAGIDVNDGVMTNPYAGIVVYPTDGVTLARGISVNTDPANADGTVLATVAAPADPCVAADPAAGGMIIGEWMPGAVLTHAGGAGTDALGGHRLVLLTGSREADGISSETAGMYDLYDDGAQLFLNAVAYMLQPLPPKEIEVVNASFELPGTTKQNAWDGGTNAKGTFEDVPGWTSDTMANDSGVEQGWGATDGIWTGFLMAGDPSVWNLTSYVIAEGDEFTLSVDAKNNWSDAPPALLQMTLYCDVFGTRLALATATVELTDEMATYSLTLPAADTAMAAGLAIGIELSNVTPTGGSWIGIDNVHLTAPY